MTTTADGPVAARTAAAADVPPHGVPPTGPPAAPGGKEATTDDLAAAVVRPLPSLSEEVRSSFLLLGMSAGVTAGGAALGGLLHLLS